MKLVTSPADVPLGPHYAVIVYVEKSIYDGWEHERGGPSSETVAEHYVTGLRAEWEAKIASLEEPGEYRQKPKYVAFEVPRLAVVKRQVVVSVGSDK